MAQMINYLPFFMLATDGKGIKINMTRVIEAVIIAGIAGIGAGIIATKELKIEVANLKAQISTISTKIDCLDNRLWQHQVDSGYEEVRK